MTKKDALNELSYIIGNTKESNFPHNSCMKLIEYIKSLPDDEATKLPINPPEWFYKLIDENYSEIRPLSIKQVWYEIVGKLSKPVEPKWYEKLKYNDKFVNNLHPTHQYHFSDLELCIKSTYNIYIPVKNCSLSPCTTKDIIKELTTTLTDRQKELLEQIPYQFIKFK